MDKKEIAEFIKARFRNLNKYFQKALYAFGEEDIVGFRNEIKKLKVFLHLLSMESEDGLSYRISKNMKTIYGYLGIIQDLQKNLKDTNKYLKISTTNIPYRYVNILEKELQDWEKLNKDFINPGFDFLNDEHKILATLPDKLTKKSIVNFIDYTLYELKSIDSNLQEEGLNNARKLLEDIYYNFQVVKPFLSPQQRVLFDEKNLGECLSLYDNSRHIFSPDGLLLCYNVDALDEQEKLFIKKMKDDWMSESKELKAQLASRLHAIQISANNLKELSQQE
jgi:hypothetical protein